MLEAGPNPFPGLDERGPLPPALHSNDELKYAVRSFITPFPELEPRTFRDRCVRRGAHPPRRQRAAEVRRRRAGRTPT